MSPGRNADARRWTYDVVGMLAEQSGLSVAARNTVVALQASGRAVESLSVCADPAVQAPARDRRPADRRISVLHLNPIDIAVFAPQWITAVSADSLLVCVPFWELPLVPRSWERILGAMDVVLAPTDFVKRACEAAVPGLPVLHYPQAVFVPPGIRPARDKWGLGPRSTVFIVAFDIGSDIDRKNPWAALEAFQGAFPSDAAVQLVIKMKPCHAAPVFARQAEELRRRIGADPRVRIVDASLPYDEVLELYASCDVMVSLHRSEGLGLHLMEAMSLGRALVATNWSGNAEFMSPDASVPVGYRLVPVRTDHPSYQTEVGRAGQVWAEPNVREAVEAMRGLHGSRDQVRTLGAAAADLMSRRREAMTSNAVYGPLEELLSDLPADHARLVDAVAQARKRFWISAVRSKIWRVRHSVFPRRGRR